mgnify:FL=1
MRMPWQKPAEKRELTEVEFFRMFERVTTKAGATVNSETALYSSVVAACLLVRAESKATLPIHLYIEEDGRRRKAVERPEYALLKNAPNPTMTSAQFWLWQQMTTDLTGNAYALREKRGTATTAIYPLVGETLPVIERKNGTPRVVGYKHRDGSGWQPLLTADVLHFPSSIIGSDGVTGRSLVDVAREAIGLDISAEEFMGRVLANGTHMGVVLSTDQALTTEDMEALRQQLSDGKGVAPAGKARLFTKGIKPMVLGSTVQEAELIEARRYGVERICGIFRVPLTKVAAMWFGTYSNSEQSDLDFAKGCVTPMVVSTEQVLNARLFSGTAYYVKFDINGIMRGDFATRMEGLTSAVNGGIFTPNEARAWEELDPLPGGDELRFPLNTMPASQLDEMDDEPEPEVIVPQAASLTTREVAIRSREYRERLVQQWMPVWADTYQRIVNREIADVKREVDRQLRSKRASDAFRIWLADYYNAFGEHYARQMLPTLKTYIAQVLQGRAGDVPMAIADIESWVDGYVDIAGRAYVGRSLGRIDRLLAESTDPVRDLEAMFGEWAEGRALTEARRESVEASEAAKRRAWREGGVTRLIWQTTSGDPCPLCEEVDGIVVGIDDPFVAEGATLAAGTDKAYTLGHPTFHPPLHGSCMCELVPA